MPRIRTAAYAVAALGAAAVVVPLVVPVRPVGDVADPTELGGPDSHFVDVPLEGGPTVRVHYEDHGDAEMERTYLLMHNFFGSTFSWRKLIPGLTEHGRVIAYDRPAFGLTERPEPGRRGERDPYTRAANADLAVGLLDALGVEDAILVGSSAGGTMAFEVALRTPERVRSLVLLSPAVNGDVGPPAALRPLLRSPQGRRLGPVALRRLADWDIERYRDNFHDPALATEEGVAGYRRPLAIDRWDEALFATMVAEAPPHLGPELPGIEMPALVIGGASDRTVLPDHNRRTAAALAHGRYVEIDACGHLPHEECPDDVIAAIVEHRGVLDGEDG